MQRVKNKAEGVSGVKGEARVRAGAQEALEASLEIVTLIQQTHFKVTSHRIQKV